MDEKRFNIYDVRLAIAVLILVVGALVKNPWAIWVLLAVAATGLLFALAIHHSNRHEPPSLFGPKRE